MTSQPKPPNPLLRWLPLIIFGISVVAGAAYLQSRVEANEKQIAGLDKTTRTDHDTITKMGTDLEYVKEDVQELRADVKEIGVQQQEQSLDLREVKMMLQQLVRHTTSESSP